MKIKQFRILFLVISIVLVSSFRINAQIPEFKTLLLQFVENMRPGAFEGKFSLARWKRKIRRARSARRMARLLLRFETKISRGNLQRSWRKKRKSWREFLRSAISISEVAKATYQLELKIRWSGTVEEWRRARRLWVRQIQSLY